MFGELKRKIEQNLGIGRQGEAGKRCYPTISIGFYRSTVDG
jgi:hypothetical protein